MEYMSDDEPTLRDTPSNTPEARDGFISRDKLSPLSRAVSAAHRVHESASEVAQIRRHLGLPTYGYQAQAIDLQSQAADLETKLSEGDLDESAVKSLEESVDALASTVHSDRLAMRCEVAEFIKQALTQIEADMPANWPSDGSPPETDIIAFMDSSGWPVIWIPEEHLVKQLVDTPIGTKENLLDSESDAVLDACSTALQQVTGTGIAALASCALDAVKAGQAGLWAASQALAAVSLDTTLQLHCGYTLGDARQIDDDPDLIEPPFYRYALIMSCIPHSLQNYWPTNGDPIPTEFNRHASIHAVSPEQYNKVNALVALIYMTSLVREVHELQLRGEW